MGLLSNELIESDFCVNGSFYSVHDVYVHYHDLLNTSEMWPNSFTGHTPTQQAIEKMNCILDSKGRLRIDQQELLDYVIGTLIKPEMKHIVVAHKPYVSIAHNIKKGIIHYTIMLRRPISVKEIVKPGSIDSYIWNYQEISMIFAVNLYENH